MYPGKHKRFNWLLNEVQSLSTENAENTLDVIVIHYTKMKDFTKDLFSKCGQIRRSHSSKIPLLEILFFFIFLWWYYKFYICLIYVFFPLDCLHLNQACWIELCWLNLTSIEFIKLRTTICKYIKVSVL